MHLNCLANYRQERESFGRLWAKDSPERILLFCGQSGCGKTSLLTICRRTIPDHIFLVFVDCRGDGVNVAEVFNRISDRIGWDWLPELNRQITAHIEVNSNQITGDGNRINVVMNSGNLQEQDERRAQLTNVLLQDLNRLEQPLLLVFDTYEKAGPDLRGWLRSVISRLPRACSKLRLVVAGQEVPSTETSEEWIDCCREYKLKGVPEPEHWLPVIKERGRRVPSDHPLSYLAGLCDFTKGSPRQISAFIETFPRLF